MLDALINFHINFLRKLLQKRKQETVVDSISEIIYSEVLKFYFFNEKYLFRFRFYFETCLIGGYLNLVWKFKGSLLVVREGGAQWSSGLCLYRILLEEWSMWSIIWWLACKKCWFSTIFRCTFSSFSSRFQIDFQFQISTI